MNDLGVKLFAAFVKILCDSLTNSMYHRRRSFNNIPRDLAQNNGNVEHPELKHCTLHITKDPGQRNINWRNCGWIIPEVEPRNRQNMLEILE